MKKNYFLIFLVAVQLLVADSFLSWQNIHELMGPQFTGARALSSLEIPPFSTTLNPATAGFVQRTTASLNGSLLFSTNDNFYQGLSVSTGFSVPSRYGVGTATMQLLSSKNQYLDAGTQLFGSFSLSKDVVDDISLGFGLNYIVGGKSLSGGIGLDFGFLHKLEKFWIFQDTSWGAALTNVGYYPVIEESASIRPFIFSTGGNGYILQRDRYSINYRADIVAASFMNLTLTNGFSFSWDDTFFFDTGFSIDIRKILHSSYSHMLPSVGFRFNFNWDIDSDREFIQEQGWTRNTVLTGLGFSKFNNDFYAISSGLSIAFGVVDNTAPEIHIDIDGINLQPEQKKEVDEQEVLEDDETAHKPIFFKQKETKHSFRVQETRQTQSEKILSKDNILAYISPNNDGVQDFIEIPVTIQDSRFILGYEFIVEDFDGNIVRTIGHKQELPEKFSLKLLFERLFRPKSGIDIPETIRWDGTTDAGTVADDGVYSFFIRAWDDNSNVGESKRFYVVVDNTPPAIEIQEFSELDLIFSPDDDGNKDTFPLSQSGSQEDLWNAQFLDSSGNIVRTFLFTESEPQDLEWDGRGDDGRLLPDGVYSYRIQATDRAGNRSSKTVENIILTTIQTPISLSISDRYFSPNDSNVKDTIAFLPNVRIQTGILKWNLHVEDIHGQTLRSFSGSNAVPEKIIFDGKDTTGKTLPEGTYKGFLVLEYASGNNPKAESPEIIIDITAPRANITSNYAVFSPNGSGIRDTITFFQEGSREDHWKAFVLDEAGKPVFTKNWLGIPAAEFEWDAIGDNGRLVNDGQYTYFIESTDRAGNKGSSSKISFEVNTEETPVILTPEYAAFSPNRIPDGVRDVQRLIPNVKINRDIVRYTLTILDDSNNTVKTFTGRNRIPDVFEWMGDTDENIVARDGFYYAELDVLYLNGNNPVAKTNLFELDTIYPELELSIPYTLFAPTGDGKKDVLPIQQSSSVEELWTAKIVDSDGHIIRDWFWKGRVESLEWNARDDSGNRVQDGVYTYVIRSTDRAGNTTEKRIENIRVDARPTQAFITNSVSGFAPVSPDSRMSFNVVLSLREGLSQWEVVISNRDKTSVKTFQGTGIPSQINWDGRNDNGNIVEGYYRASLRAVYEKGDEPTAVSSEFLLDKSPPVLLTDISPKPFSPDNDGVDDELSIRLAAENLSPIDKWKFEIFDPYDNYFTKFQGEGAPSPVIVWDGRGANGSLVRAAEDYKYTFTVTDVLGNTAEEKGIIPVDVLVIRDGDRLKIQISSIIFAPNSDQLDMRDPRIADQNDRVLKRLAEILTRFNRYNIIIEGYAVITRLSSQEAMDAEQREELLPLSKARAETVKKTLVNLGISESRMSTEGYGGLNPIVPHNDIQNRWQNRRVEFILVR